MQVDLSVIISSYEGRDRIMNENLIVEDNTIYEIDPECLKKKREQEARKKSEEKLKNDAEYWKNHCASSRSVYLSRRLDSTEINNRER